jgi:hypothetical protein
MLHRLKAGFGLRVRCRAVPPFQVAKRLLNVAPGEFGFNSAAKICHPNYPILH